MAAGREWRLACVTRAQTIARDLRMIDLAIEGPLPRIAPGARVDFVVALDGAPAIRAFDCMAAPNGRLRITVGADDGDGALRFMWSLVEGATVRVTVPEHRGSGAAPPRPVPPDARPALPFPILAVKDAILLSGGRPGATDRPIVANSSIV